MTREAEFEGIANVLADAATGCKFPPDDQAFPDSAALYALILAARKVAWKIRNEALSALDFEDAETAHACWQHLQSAAMQLPLGREVK